MAAIPPRPPTGLSIACRPRMGGVLSPHGLSIDMTYFEAGGKSYIAWSQGDQERKGAKANVSIAEVNSDKPWQAITEPQRLMRPEGLGAGRRK